MKILLIFSVVLITLQNARAQFYTPPPEQPKNFGAGIMVGEPTGLNFQLRQNEHLYDFGAAWSLNKESTLFADYKALLPSIIPKIIRKSSAPITAYAGIGAYMQFEKEPESKLAMGARFPLGFEHRMHEYPLTFFLELVPAMKIITETDLELMAGIGGRYYF